MQHRMLLITYPLTLVILFICVKIEYLNHLAGGRLQILEHYSSDPKQDHVKWRQSAFASESLWLRIKGPQNEDGAPADRPLSAEERAQMDQDIARAQANNALRSFVGSAGLLQYLLVPAALFLGFIELMRRREARSSVWMAIPPIAISLGCGIIMLYRSYFPSLGW